MAVKARAASRQLQALPSEQRVAILNRIAGESCRKCRSSRVACMVLAPGPAAVCVHPACDMQRHIQLDYLLLLLTTQTRCWSTRRPSWLRMRRTWRRPPARCPMRCCSAWCSSTTKSSSWRVSVVPKGAGPLHVCLNSRYATSSAMSKLQRTRAACTRRRHSGHRQARGAGGPPAEPARGGGGAGARQGAAAGTGIGWAGAATGVGMAVLLHATARGGMQASHLWLIHRSACMATSQAAKQPSGARCCLRTCLTEPVCRPSAR